MTGTDGDDRAVGRRQVQNIVADLRDSGYLRVLEAGGHGVDAEYQLEDDPGRPDVDLPEPADGAGDSATDSPPAADEKTAIEQQYSWNFVRSGADGAADGVVPPSRPTIPAADTADGGRTPG